MAGDRGSGYNAFTLFLIFVLLYLSQKSTNASVYSETGKTVEPEETPGMPLEGKLAVGLSNGDVMEVPEMAEEVVPSDTTLGNTVYQPAIMDQELSEQPVEEETTEDIMLEDEVEIPVSSTEAPMVEEPVEVENEEEGKFEAQVEENTYESDVQQYQEISAITDEQGTEETLEVAEEAEVTEDIKEAEVIEEPVLGGQSNLFLQPTVMTGFDAKKQQTGPKISINFGK